MNDFYVLEIEVMKNGTVAKAISDGKSKNNALSQFHQTLASAVINEDVKSVFCEVLDVFGNKIVEEYREV